METYRNIPNQCDYSSRLVWGMAQGFRRPRLIITETYRNIPNPEKSTNQQKILSEMMKEPRISAQKPSETIGISVRKTEENIKKLKDKGLIKRIGAAKGGYWEAAVKTYEGKYEC